MTDKPDPKYESVALRDSLVEAIGAFYRKSGQVDARGRPEINLNATLAGLAGTVHATVSRVPDRNGRRAAKKEFLRVLEAIFADVSKNKIAGL